MDAVNFPFIKTIQFEEIEVENNDKLNRRIKSEFFMFLNCRKWRHMNLIRHSTAEKLYCEIKLQEKILQIRANCDAIKICREAIKKFKNVEFVKI